MECKSIVDIILKNLSINLYVNLIKMLIYMLLIALRFMSHSFKDYFPQLFSSVITLEIEKKTMSMSINYISIICHLFNIFVHCCQKPNKIFEKVKP